MPKALYAVIPASLRRLPLSFSAVVFMLAMAAAVPLAAQDDITTQDATHGNRRRMDHRPGIQPAELFEWPGLAFRRQSGAL